MWKRITNFWKEWSQTYNDLNTGNLVYFSSYDGTIVWVIHIEENEENNNEHS